MRSLHEKPYWGPGYSPDLSPLGWIWAKFLCSFSSKSPWKRSFRIFTVIICKFSAETSSNGYLYVCAFMYFICTHTHFLKFSLILEERNLKSFRSQFKVLIKQLSERSVGVESAVLKIVQLLSFTALTRMGILEARTYRRASYRQLC